MRASVRRLGFPPACAKADLGRCLMQELLDLVHGGLLVSTQKGVKNVSEIRKMLCAFVVMMLHLILERIC
jgi:hypothetical protein